MSSFFSSRLTAWLCQHTTIYNMQEFSLCLDSTQSACINAVVYPSVPSLCMSHFLLFQTCSNAKTAFYCTFIQHGSLLKIRARQCCNRTVGFSGRSSCSFKRLFVLLSTLACQLGLESNNPSVQIQPCLHFTLHEHEVSQVHQPQQCKS